MANEKPLYTLYKGLKANNYDVPENYESFERTLTSGGQGGSKHASESRHILYNALKAQNFDVPDSYESFYSTLFEPINATTSRAKGGYASGGHGAASVHVGQSGAPTRAAASPVLPKPLPSGFGRLSIPSTPMPYVDEARRERAKVQGEGALRSWRQRVNSAQDTKDLEPTQAEQRAIDSARAAKKEEQTQQHPYSGAVGMLHEAQQGDTQAQKALADAARPALQQRKDALDYADATGGKMLRNPVEIGMTLDHEGNVVGAPMYAPTVARDEKGDMILGDDGKPLVGMTSEQAARNTYKSGMEDAVEAEKRRRAEDINRHLEDAYRTRDELDEQLKNRREELEKKPWWGKALEDMGKAAHSDLDPMATADDPEHQGFENDEEYMQLMSAARKNHQMIQALEDKRDGKMDNFWHALGTTAMNGYTFADGLPEMRDATAQEYAKKHIKAINEKRQKGLPLTREEQVAEAVLQANYANDAVQSKYGDDYGKRSRAGAMMANSIDYMKDFLLMPGAEGTAKAIAGKIASVAGKVLVKEAGESALKAFPKAIARATLKATGVLVGAHTAGAVISNTTGMGRTAALMAQKASGNVTKDENGNYKIENEEGLMHALASAEREQMRENGSEMVGGFLGGKAFGGLAKKGLEKIGLSKVSNFLTQMGSKDWYKKYSQFLKTGGYNGIPGEAFEEYEGQLFDALTGHAGDAWNDFTSAKQNTDIWLGSLTMGALMGAIPMGIHISGYYKFRHDMNKADKVAAYRMTKDKWAPLKEELDNTDNGHMADVVAKRILMNNELSAPEKKAALGYVRGLTKFRAFNIAQVSNAGDEESQKSQEQNDAYRTGYNAVDGAADEHGIKVAYEQARDGVAGMYGEQFADQLDEDPVSTIETLEDGSKGQALASEYLRAKVAYEGMIQRAQDDMEDHVQEVTQQVERRVNTTEQGGDGMIHRATLKAKHADGTEHQVYVVNGTVQMTADGKMVDKTRSSASVVVYDPDTDKMEMVSPESIFTVDEAVDPTEELQVAVDAARNQFAEMRADQIDGFVPKQNPQQNDEVTVKGDDGQAVRGVVTEVDPLSGMYMVQTAEAVNGKKMQPFAVGQLYEATGEKMDETGSVSQKEDGTEAGRKRGNVAEAAGDTDGRRHTTAANTTGMDGSETDETATGTESAGVTAMEKIPVAKDAAGNDVIDKKTGMPVYRWHEASVEDTAEALAELNEGSLINARDTAQDMEVVTNDRLTKLRKRKAAGSDPISISRSRQQNRLEVEDAEKELAHWRSVKDEINRRMTAATAQRLQAEEAAKSEEQKAAEAEAKRKAQEAYDKREREQIAAAIKAENVKRNKEYPPLVAARKAYADDPEAMEVLSDTEPRDLEETVSSLLKPHSILWSDTDRGGFAVRGLKSELGLQVGDMRRFMNLIGTVESGAKSVSEVAEDIWANMPEDMQDRYTDHDVKNVILDLFGLDNSSKMLNVAAENRIAQARHVYENNLQREEEAALMAYAEAHHIRPDEVEDFKDWLEQTFPDIIIDEETLARLDEIFAEQLIEQEEYERSHGMGGRPESTGVDRGGQEGQGVVRQQGTAEPGIDTGTAEEGAKQETAEPDAGQAVFSDGVSVQEGARGVEASQTEDPTEPRPIGKDTQSSDRKQGNDEKSLLGIAISDYLDAYARWGENIDDNSLHDEYKNARDMLVNLLEEESDESLERLVKDSPDDVVKVVMAVRQSRAEAREAIGIHARWLDEHGRIERVSKKNNVGPLSFVSPASDVLHPVLHGVLHDGGMVVGADGSVLMAQRLPYDAGLEGKVTDGLGNIIEGRYPNWRRVLRSGGKPLGADLDDLESWTNGVYALLKRDKVKKAEQDATLVSLRDTEGKVHFYQLGTLSRVVSGARAIGAEGLMVNAEEMLFANTEEGSVIAMPRVMPDGFAEGFAYDGGTVERQRGAELSVFGGNRGYVGYSMSKRASHAREEGRYPKTDFKKEYGIGDTSFGLLLDAGLITGGEWHHTSMFGNRTTFYGWGAPWMAEAYRENKQAIDRLARERGKDNTDRVESLMRESAAYRVYELEQARAKRDRELYARYQQETSKTIPGEYVTSSGAVVLTNGSRDTSRWNVTKDGVALTKRSGKDERNAARQELEAWLRPDMSFEEWLSRQEDETLENDTEARQLATKAVVTALGNAGVDVVMATDEQAAAMIGSDRGDVKLHTPDYGGSYTYLPVEEDLPGAEKQIVYHGSGAKFDGFDSSHMGEGEGAQAYGWGHYVTEVEGIGRMYAKKSPQATGLKRSELESNIRRAEERLPFAKGSVKSELERDIVNWKAELENLGDGNPILYAVDIPDDIGSNYLQWEKPLPEEQLSAIEAYLNDNYRKSRVDMFTGGIAKSTATNAKEVDDFTRRGDNVYHLLESILGDDKSVSEMLGLLGYSGISYPAQYQSGSREDGKRNYVIFNDSDLKIVDRVEFMQSPKGTVYGWTVGGKIYLTNAGMNPNTPIHEYTHLWAAAMRRRNAAGWESIKNLLKGTPVWDEVVNDENYADIRSDEDAVASEALSRISGRENAGKMEAEAQKVIDEAKDVFAKADAVTLLDRMRRALTAFWKWVGTELFDIREFDSIDEVTDRVLYDLVSGTDLKVDGASFNVEKQITRDDVATDEEEDIIARAKADGSYLKAPNGEPSNLSERQWVQVRTQAFKQWFGDWEKDPESASKVVDENGEPLVVDDLFLHLDNRNPIDKCYKKIERAKALLEKCRQVEKETGYKLKDKRFIYTSSGSSFYDEFMSVPDDVMILFEAIYSGAKPKLSVCFRYGDIRENQRSFNSRDDIFENGVSVVGHVKDLNTNRSNYYQAFFGNSSYNVVIGVENGYRGADGEILLSPAYVISTADNISNIAKSATVNNGDFSVGDADIRYRHGDGALTDGELSYEHDPVGKMLGSSTRTARQRREFAERERERMADAVAALAKKLNLNDVEVVTDVSQLDGRRSKAKGFFSKSTGKITIVIPNHASVEDAEKTLLHEAVAHYGLRQLFGKQFDTFLDNVFLHAEPEIRREIVALAAKRGWDFRTATEEYLAGLAEDTNFEKMPATFWMKIKRLFLDMLHGLGFEGWQGPELGDNELRYLLWRSYENLKEPGRYRSILGEAADVVKQYELKVGNYEEAGHSHGMAVNGTEGVNGAKASEKENVVKPGAWGKRDLLSKAEQVSNGIDADLLFRDSIEDDNNTARATYNAWADASMQIVREAWQDSMINVRNLQNAVLDQRGERLEDWEDAYNEENRSHGRSRAESEYFGDNLYKPLLEAVNQAAKAAKVSVGDVVEYMMAKHGLERNRVFAERDAKVAWEAYVQKQEEAFAEYQAAHKKGRKTLEDFMEKSYEDFLAQKRERDYSGLTALTGVEDVQEAEAEARGIVEDMEEKAGADSIRVLWDRTNAATKWTLRKAYESGVVSKDNYEHVRDMFAYYIPLRGWDENTAADIYDYVGSGDNGNVFSPTLHTAKGRGSRADNPIAYIGSMAVSAIVEGNKNKVKQSFMRFVENHPTNLVTVSEMWYVNDGTAEAPVWREDVPDIPEDATADDVARIVREHEEAMKQKEEQGLATKKRGGLHLRVPVKKGEALEHHVEVLVNGKKYVLYINGNPRAAQALNGTRARRASARSVESNQIGRLNRWLGQAYTSLSPAFAARNATRDLTMALITTAIKEDPAYAMLFRLNVARLGGPVRMFTLMRWYNDYVSEHGLTPPEGVSRTKRYFYEFITQGSETGYTSLKEIDDYKKDMEKLYDNMNRKIYNPMRLMRDLAGGLEYANRCIEDMTRFATYMTSRERGRSIRESTSDAKNITLNFNRKGSGELGNATYRNLQIFVNPSIQSLQNVASIASHHPVKFTLFTGLVSLVGFAMPLATQLLWSVFGGDGDDDGWNAVDEYWKLPSWQRRNNLVIWIPGTRKFAMIALAQEYRVFHGFGETVMSVLSGHDGGRPWLELASQALDLLPLDVMGNGGNPLVNFAPTVLQPALQVSFNSDFTGRPLYKDSEYNKDEPAFQKAYVGTPSWLVSSSELLNDVTGGNAHRQGWLEQVPIVGNLNNPAVVDHLLKGYLGGIYTFLAQLGSVGWTLASGESPTVHDVPVANALVTAPREREQSGKAALPDWYYDMQQENQQWQNERRGFRRDYLSGDSSAKAQWERLEGDSRQQVISRLIREVQSIRTALQYTPEEDEAQRRALEGHLNEVLEQLHAQSAK